MGRVLFLLLVSCFSSYFSFSQNYELSKGKFLIVLDVQEYHTIDKLSESEPQNLIDSINYVINNFDSEKVIYVKRTHEVLNLSFSYPFIYVSYDTVLMRLDKRMNLVNENIFTKDESNAFSIIELNDFLKQNNAKEIVVIGIMAEEGVYESVIAGKELGYKMFVIPQAITGESKESKSEVLKELAEEGIETLDITTLKTSNSTQSYHPLVLFEFAPA